jgi:hypothetical protein
MIALFSKFGCSIAGSGNTSPIHPMLFVSKRPQNSMEELMVSYIGNNYTCIRYNHSDEPRILDVFFFWKTAVLLAEQTESKKPQLPETFSEPFCSLVCSLVHKLGAGIDAFRLNQLGQVEAAIEIKATITASGFTDVKRDLGFDELYWLSLASYNSLSYEIHRITRDQISRFAAASNTQRDRATVNLAKIVERLSLKPIFRGHIGIVREDLSLLTDT